MEIITVIPAEMDTVGPDHEYPIHLSIPYIKGHHNKQTNIVPLSHQDRQSTRLHQKQLHSARRDTQLLTCTSRTPCHCCTDAAPTGNWPTSTELGRRNCSHYTMQCNCTHNHIAPTAVPRQVISQCVVLPVSNAGPVQCLSVRSINQSIEIF